MQLLEKTNPINIPRVDYKKEGIKNSVSMIIHSKNDFLFLKMNQF